MMGDDILKSDKALMAAFSGILSTLPYEIFTRILLFFGYGKYSFYQLDSLIITTNRIDVIMGFIISSLVSVLTAVLFHFTLASIKTEHLVIKSILFSLLMWAAMEIVFTAIIEGKTIPVRPISDYYNHLLGVIIYGITQGLLFKQLLFSKGNR